MVSRGDITHDCETNKDVLVVCVTNTRADEYGTESYNYQKTTVVADYGANADYPDDDVVVEGVYTDGLDNVSLDAAADEKTYAFPISRLD